MDLLDILQLTFWNSMNILNSLEKNIYVLLLLEYWTTEMATHTVLDIQSSRKWYVKFLHFSLKSNWNKILHFSNNIIQQKVEDKNI